MTAERRVHRQADPMIEHNDDGSTVAFHGYATVYDFEYDVFGGPDRGGFTEVVLSGAGTNTLKRRPDVRLLVNHAGVPMARSTRGTLLLFEDTMGLVADAPALDFRNPTVQEISSAMDRGDLDEMSFAFRVEKQTWNDDYTYREIVEYDLAVKGADVSIVTYPANDATLALLRIASGVDELRAARCPVGGLDIRAARAIADRLREAHA